MKFSSIHGWISTAAWLCLLAAWTSTSYGQAGDGSSPSVDAGIADKVVNGTAEIPVAPRPSAWDRFSIFVWQFKTEASKDWDLYQQVGLHAFHVDRGAGQQQIVDWAMQNGAPYYVDHAAGKGRLHLTPATGLNSLREDGSLQARPQSLITSAALQDLRQQMDENLAVAARGPALAIALDDEVSLGTFNSPYEVDSSPASIALYQKWLEAKYVNISALNRQWDTDWSVFAEVQPSGFETVRQKIAGQPFSQWNLSPWMDWRAYMDDQFTAVLADGVQYGRRLAPGIPIGVVGGQQPSPYGGYDYSKLHRAVQWIESYDIGGTNELLTSFWNESRKPIVQTFFATGDATRDQWFLWYYWAHGNSAVIAWPDLGNEAWFQNGQILPAIAALSDTFSEIQRPALGVLSSPEAKLQYDPVAILYSHASVQASWATDALVHGKTWPRRSSSLDNACSSAGKSRVAWSKLLEDCGIQARWISVDELEHGKLHKDQFKLLILPRTLALSDESCTRLQQFAEGGGVIVADYWTALLDEHGKARVNNQGKLQGGLDGLFDIVRDEAAGYFDGSTFSEINGEQYQKPFLERLPNDVVKLGQLMLVERGTRRRKDTQLSRAQQRSERLEGEQALIRNAQGAGRNTVYLNASPVAYFDDYYRLSEAGKQWRKVISDVLAQAQVALPVRIERDGQRVPMAEVLRWQSADADYVVVIGNPSREAYVDGAGGFAIPVAAGPVTLHFETPIESATDLRTQRVYSAGSTIQLNWQPAQATILKVEKP